MGKTSRDWLHSKRYAIGESFIIDNMYTMTRNVVRFPGESHSTESPTKHINDVHCQSSTSRWLPNGVKEINNIAGRIIQVLVTRFQLYNDDSVADENELARSYRSCQDAILSKKASAGRKVLHRQMRVSRTHGAL